METSHTYAVLCAVQSPALEVVKKINNHNSALLEIDELMSLARGLDCSVQYLMYWGKMVSINSTKS